MDQRVRYMKFFFHFLLKNEFLNINHKCVLNAQFHIVLIGNENERMECRPKKIIIVKDVNDDEMFVLISFGEVLEVNERGKCFYKTMREIVERTYNVISTYNTKINLVTPRTRLYISYKKCFQSNGQCNL